MQNVPFRLMKPTFEGLDGTQNCYLKSASLAELFTLIKPVTANLGEVIEIPRRLCATHGSRPDHSGAFFSGKRVTK